MSAPVHNNVADQADAHDLPEDLPAELVNQLVHHGTRLGHAYDLFMRKARCTASKKDDPPYRFFLMRTGEELATRWYRTDGALGILMVNGPSFDKPRVAAHTGYERKMVLRVWLNKKKGFAGREWNIIKTTTSWEEFQQSQNEELNVLKSPGKHTQIPQNQFRLLTTLASPDRPPAAQAQSPDIDTGTTNVPEASIPVKREHPKSDDPIELDPEGESVKTTWPNKSRKIEAADKKIRTSQSYATTLQVSFINDMGEIVRTRPWKKCCTMQDLLIQVSAASIVDTLNNKFVLKANLDGLGIRMAKDDIDDFQDLLDMVDKWKHNAEMGAIGTVSITLESEIKNAAV
jgi:hypothetical protein